MILHRFMSEAEFERLLAGERLTNTTDFHGEQGRHTTSVGFCFFPEDPDEAIHWLRGIVRAYEWQGDYRIDWNKRCDADRIVKAERLTIPDTGEV